MQCAQATRHTHTHVQYFWHQCNGKYVCIVRACVAELSCAHTHTHTRHTPFKANSLADLAVFSPSPNMPFAGHYKPHDNTSVPQIHLIVIACHSTPFKGKPAHVVHRWQDVQPPNYTWGSIWGGKWYPRQCFIKRGVSLFLPSQKHLPAYLIISYLSIVGTL